MKNKICISQTYDCIQLHFIAQFDEKNQTNRDNLPDALHSEMDMEESSDDLY